VHRDHSIGGGSVGVALYDDRLEIISIGELHFGLTPEALFREHESKPWNPMIARTFYRRGIIETWGRGTLKIVRLMREHGLEPPAVSVRDRAVVVKFGLPATRKTLVQPETPEKTPEKTPEITPVQPETREKTPEKTDAGIIRLLQEQPGLTMADLAHRLRKSPSAIVRAVRRLRESGRLQRIGPDKGGHWQVLE